MMTIKKAAALLLSAVLAVPFAAAPALAAASGPCYFQGLRADGVRLIVQLSTTTAYSGFMTKDPDRLVLELDGVVHQGPLRRFPGFGPFISDVRSSQFRGSPNPMTRVVLDLKRAARWRVSREGSDLVVSLADPDRSGSGLPRVPAPPRPALSAPASVTPPASAAASAPAPGPDAPAPDFSAAAAFRRAGLKGRMSSELAAEAQAEDVTKGPMDIPGDAGDDSHRDRPALGGRIYTDLLSRLPRDPISLDFDNTDIGDVIRLLAAKARMNIIYGPDVSGSLTLHLSRVPFSEAFRAVLSMMQLTTYQVGDNVLRVITPAELVKQRTATTAITKVIPLNYAKAADVKATIDSVRQAEGRAGSTSVDSKTNSLIVTETLEGLLATENLVAQLDQRPRQVLIEAKLVEVNADNELNYGVNWSAFGVENNKLGGTQGQTILGTTAGIGTGATAASPVNPLTGNASLNYAVNAGQPNGANGQGTGVNLAADRIFGALTLGRVTNNYILNATLTAAASQGKVKVLSDPKIATLNNQAATINVTTQIPYVTSNVASTGVQTQTVNYVTTGIQLTVTPSINADGRILLAIQPNVSQPSATAAGSTQTGAPAVDSRNANTTVLVRDGETIVIGGLISDSVQDTISKIPLLGDIPILGWLFKKKTKKRSRNELLIFVTSRVLPD